MSTQDIDSAVARIEGLTTALSKQQEEICQIAGKALGYPWYKDDKKNFPDATEEHGVCVGDQVAETIVAELADKYTKIHSAMDVLTTTNSILSNTLTRAQADGSRLAMENQKLRSTLKILHHDVPVEVACAIIRSWDPDFFLISQRPADTSMGGKWEFPGGKQHDGESLEQCASREVWEELGIVVDVLGEIYQEIIVLPYGTFNLHFFLCTVDYTQTPQKLGCQQWAYVKLRDLYRYDMLPIDSKLAKLFAISKP